MNERRSSSISDRCSMIGARFETNEALAMLAERRIVHSLLWLEKPLRVTVHIGEHDDVWAVHARRH